MILPFDGHGKEELLQEVILNFISPGLSTKVFVKFLDLIPEPPLKAP